MTPSERAKQYRAKTGRTSTAAVRKFRAENPDRAKAIAARAREKQHPGHRFELNIRRKYGLTAEGYAWLFVAQDGACPLCEKPLDLSKPSGAVVDHDHKTGRVRGILHSYCNHKILGMIERGGPIRAKNAIKYLGWANGAP